MILRPGTFLQDRYEILDKIGSGGMSDVYKALCHKLKRQVAIKVLKEEFSSDIIYVYNVRMGQSGRSLGFHLKLAHKSAV